MSTIPNLHGHGIERLELSVPARGPWTASVLLVEEARDLPQRAVLDVGDVRLIGHAVQSGEHAGARSLIVMGGAADWATIVRARPYQVETGVRALLVIQDLCRELQQELGTITPSAERLAGQHYTRNATRASTVLESVIGTASWWIDYAGRLQVGTRPTTPLKVYQLLGYDPANSVAELALDDLAGLSVGSQLGDGLDTPRTVSSYEVIVDSGGIRARCALAESAALPDVLRALIAQQVERTVPQIRRYRVLSMNGNRVDIQAVASSSGYPDLVSVSQWCGVAGAWCELLPQQEVLVAWIAGDRSQPVIVGFADRDSAGFMPNQIVFADSDKAAARIDDTIEVEPLIGQTITFGGEGATSPMSLGTPYPFHFTPTQLKGKVTSGSSKVRL